jgi:hypothetical protein
MRPRSLLVPIAAAAMLACSDSPGAPINGGTGTAQLTLLNALAAGDAASLKLDGAAIALPPAGQSGTAVVTSGAHQLEAVTATGQTLASTTFSIADGSHRTTVLSGSSGHYVMVLNAVDTASVPVVDGVKMRLVHTVAGAPSMDAYLFEVGHAADSSARFITPFNFGTGSDPRFPGYAVRPAGQYDVWLKAAGTDNVLVQFGPITVGNGDVYSFILAENAAGALEIRAVNEH